MMIRKLVLLILILSNIGCDQVSKGIVRKNISAEQVIGFYNNNFIITKVENTGAALGLGQSLPPISKYILLNVIPLCALILMLSWIGFRNKNIDWQTIGFSFIIGGGLGNLIDRFLYGSVTDFFHIDLGLFKTGIFNMADVSVTVGAILLITHTILVKKTQKTQLK
jgi:signal peptidase II